MGVTQKAIAIKLNVSQAHVARALAGHGAVSEETRLRIETVARELGYDRHANREARALAGRRYSQRMKTNVVALALTVPDGIVPRNMPFYSAFLEGVEAEAASSEGHFDVCIIHKRYNEIPRLLRSSELDGAIVSGFTLDQIPTIRDSGMAVVTYGVSCEGAPSVRPDDHSGMYKVTRHLLELGHRNIAYVGVLSHEDSMQTVTLREQGFRDALAEFGLNMHEEWTVTDLMIADSSDRKYCEGCEICAACVGWDALKKKAGMSAGQKPPFSAVVCYHDPIAMGIVRHAEEDGLRVPSDLSVTGFDAVSELYDFQPSITSVGCSHYEMGRSAMRLLRNAINDLADSPVVGGTYDEQQVFSVDLIPGESTAPLAVGMMQ